MVIRYPAVAGAFYPADKQVLLNKLDSFFAKTKKITPKAFPKILIVPHAGYDFSGQTAAWGFRQIKNADYQKVILLGCSHRQFLPKAAVFNQGLWLTPLGKIAIDQKGSSDLINQSIFLEANLEIHQYEHSLEVQLPFLQYVLKEFKIIPILLGCSDFKVMQSLAEIIFLNFDQKTLLVVSSDLSHYPSLEIAKKVDKRTIEAILSGDWEIFEKTTKEGLKFSGVETCACGAEAIQVAMMVANKLKLSNNRLIHYSNSGEVSFEKTRVVGYAAIGFYN